ELYNQPVDEFVAKFVGTPAMNIHASERGGENVGWRPVHGTVVASAAQAPGGSLVVTGTVEVVEFTGEGSLLSCRGEHGAFTVSHPAGEQLPRPGDAVVVAVPRERLHMFDPAGRRRVAEYV